MKKLFLTMALATATLAATAQEQDTISTPQASIELSALQIKPFIGFLSYDAALEAMPQRSLVEAQLKEQQEKYDAEMRRVENDFNKKYEDFLEGQRDFPRTILLKRQTELQQLLQQNVEFKQKARAELKAAREAAYAPLRQQLAEAIAAVAHEQGLILVVNTDANATPFIEPDKAVNIQEAVAAQLAPKSDDGE